MSGRLDSLLRIARGEFSALSEVYLPRAARSTGLEVLCGRDAILADEIGLFKDISADPEITLLGPMAVMTYDKLRRHIWFSFEHEKIAADVSIIDGERLAVLRGLDPYLWAKSLGENFPAFAPLGELRSGLGQLKAINKDLPPNVPKTAEALISSLNRLWNERDLTVLDHAFDMETRAQKALWFDLITALPDATCYLDRAYTEGDKVCLLWKVHGHFTGEVLLGLKNQPQTYGRRIRIVFSSVFTVKKDKIIGEETLFDKVASLAQGYQPILQL
jgi:predicted ester cyclase